MTRYAVYGSVEGSIYLDEFEAADEGAAMQAAEEAARVSFRHACARQCEDFVITAGSADVVR